MKLLEKETVTKDMILASISRDSRVKLNTVGEAD